MHKGRGRRQLVGTVLIEGIKADGNKAGFRHLPMIHLHSAGNRSQCSHPVVILLSLNFPTITVPAGIIPLP